MEKGIRCGGKLNIPRIYKIAKDEVGAETMGERWIDQLNEFYREILTNPDIPSGNLDEANDAILRCIEELRPLTRTYADDE